MGLKCYLSCKVSMFSVCFVCVVCCSLVRVALPWFFGSSSSDSSTNGWYGYTAMAFLDKVLEDVSIEDHLAMFLNFLCSLFRVEVAMGRLPIAMPKTCFHDCASKNTPCCTERSICDISKSKSQQIVMQCCVKYNNVYRGWGSSASTHLDNKALLPLHHLFRQKSIRDCFFLFSTCRTHWTFFCQVSFININYNSTI